MAYYAKLLKKLLKKYFSIFPHVSFEKLPKLHIKVAITFVKV